MKTTQFDSIPIENINGVLIDIDNTLYSYDHAHSIAIKTCQVEHNARFNVCLEPEEYAFLYRKNRDIITKRLYPTGSCRSRFLAFQSMFETQGIDFAYAHALHFDSFYWKTLIEAMSPNPDSLAFLKKCKNNGIKICAVTDMLASVQVEKLLSLDMTAVIDFLVSSEEVGAEKPDPRIFKAALEKLGLSAIEVVMIGDSESKDIAGAANLGIRGYLV